MIEGIYVVSGSAKVQLGEDFLTLEHAGNDQGTQCWREGRLKRLYGMHYKKETRYSRGVGVSVAECEIYADPDPVVSKLSTELSLRNQIDDIDEDWVLGACQARSAQSPRQKPAGQAPDVREHDDCLRRSKKWSTTCPVQG